MLNLAFSESLEREFGSTYAIPDAIAGQLVEANSGFATGSELRTQPVYGDELWARIQALGLGELDWSQMAVLDACCGTGFLTYHLLARISPKHVSLVDLSPDELACARDLIEPLGGDRIDFVCADLTDPTVAAEPADVVIGNSFLHHFPNVPAALETVHSLVRPGGWFVGLHDPSPVAVPLESGDLRHLVAYTLSPGRYMRTLRHRPSPTVRTGATDVWMFEPGSIEALLKEAEFDDVRIVSRYVARPFLVGAMGLHLSEERSSLSQRETTALRASLKLDDLLARVVPKRVSGGFAFAARRPA